MRPLTEKTQKILDLYDQGKDKKEIFTIINKDDTITKQGIDIALKRYRNGNGKPKTPIAKSEENEEEDYMETYKAKIYPGVKEVETFYNLNEKTKESLDSLDYDIMKKVCYRMLNQLRSKCTGNPQSATDEIVHDAEYLLDKMTRLGLIR